MDACMLESTFSMSILRSTHAIIKKGISSFIEKKCSSRTTYLCACSTVIDCLGIISTLCSASTLSKTQSNINQRLFCFQRIAPLLHTGTQLHTHFHGLFVDQACLLLVFPLLFYPSPVPIKFENSNTLPDLIY